MSTGVRDVAGSRHDSGDSLQNADPTSYFRRHFGDALVLLRTSRAISLAALPQELVHTRTFEEKDRISADIELKYVE
jgi:hypothetical protein